MLPWMIVATCAVLALGTVGVIVVKRLDRHETPRAAAAPAVMYTRAGIGDACALLDFAALELVIGKPTAPPTSHTSETPTVADYARCGPSRTASGVSFVHVEVDRQPMFAQFTYDGYRSHPLHGNGPGVVTRELSGLGESAFLIVYGSYEGNTSPIGCELDFVKVNVFVEVNVMFEKDNGSSTDKLTDACRTQAESVLGKLK
ncbi:hypothetical protein GCM10027167_16700 [Nocardia heshunensis]